MKITFFKFLVLVTIIGISFFVSLKGQRPVQKNEIPTPTQAEKPLTSEEPAGTKGVTVQKTLFVPYWTLDKNIASADAETLVYFGVAADSNGVIQGEPGYHHLDQFVEFAGSHQKKYLALRMLDAKENSKLLSDRTAQQKIITQVLKLAQSHNFDGIVLDLELSVLPSTELRSQINIFVDDLYTKTHAKGFKLGITIYGDVFYRARPFDVKVIAEHSDEIMVMAYDFTKSYGEPGPNFPLMGEKRFGYDFETMMRDYLTVVPAEKLTVIFGTFGYDWKLGPQGKPLNQASTLTLSQAKSRYLAHCKQTDCSVARDADAKETNVTFTDSEGYRHEVWFEDEESIRLKTDFLQKEGIGQVGVWAYGY